MNINKILIYSNDNELHKKISCTLEKFLNIKIYSNSKEKKHFNFFDNKFKLTILDVNSINNFDELANEIIHSKKNFNKKFILLFDTFEDNIIKKAFLSGITDIIHKYNFEKLIYCVESILNDDCLDPFTIILEEYKYLKKREIKSILSKAELEILEYIEKGYTQAKISKCLYKSQGTIKSQVNKLLKKLNVKNTKEALYKINTYGI
ncbi:MAG: LuxR C-terminal-related transcriptional regulator [Clostridiales bacterium]